MKLHQNINSKSNNQTNKTAQTLMKIVPKKTQQYRWDTKIYGKIRIIPQMFFFIYLKKVLAKGSYNGIRSIFLLAHNPGDTSI